ncbi:hypothetical protein [Streptomyces erythrochromogenes]|uniref:hypothetical protein n=1 Tax=Streptomyces erythrochromogenes TaxID=285574 RepID=UPI0037F6B125
MIRTLVRRSSVRRRALAAGAALMAVMVLTATAEGAARSESDLEVVRIDPDAVEPGGLTTVHAFIGNAGPEKTASVFTVEITLPEGVTAEGPFFPENCSDEIQDGEGVSCTFPAGLPESGSATALIPLRIGADVPLGDLTGGCITVRGDDDQNTANNRQPFVIHVVEN